MSIQNKEDKIVIIYKFDRNDKRNIKLFSDYFIINNKDKCKLIYKCKEYELIEYFDVDTNNDNEDLLSIELSGINNITDTSYMFYKCNLLISFYEKSEWKFSNITNMAFMFEGCSSLISLPDISKWNTLNVNNMSGIFHECNSLLSLPDISKWNTSNVIDMSFLFSKCTLYESI